MRSETKKSAFSVIIYGFIPFLLVISWAVCFFRGIADQRFIFSKDEHSKTKLPKTTLLINAKVFRDGEIVHEKRKINLLETVAYIDMWRSHWCTYYNDREFYFTPRINELAQILRKINIPIIHISQNIDAFSPNIKPRKQGKEIVEKGAISTLENFNANAAKYHEDYIPGFKDVCVYKDQIRFGKYRSNCLTKQIALSDSDYVVANFRESAEAFVGLGAKTVLVFGQHTNMCLMAVFQYCREVGLDLIIVEDLVDGCWIYDLQKEYASNHTSGNVVINNYFVKEFGNSIISYDLIREIRKAKINSRFVNYTQFTNHAFMFKY